MWRSEYDAEYMDEKQSKYYKKLSGAKKNGSTSSPSSRSSSTSRGKDLAKKTGSRKNSESDDSSCEDKSALHNLKYNRNSKISEYDSAARDGVYFKGLSTRSKKKNNKNDYSSSEDEKQNSIIKKHKTKINKDWVVPDLSKMTDEEFQKRIDELRNSHNETLKMCEDLGIKATDKKSTILKIPKAQVDYDYVLRSRRENSSDDESIKVEKHLSHKPPTAKSKMSRSTDAYPKPKANGSMKSFKLKSTKNGGLSRSSSFTNIQQDDACSLDGCMLNKYAHTKGTVDRSSEYKGKYTVPQPFNLTPNGLRRSSSFVRFEEDLEKRKAREEEEYKRTIKPKQLPEDTYLLKFNRMQKEEERKRRQNSASRAQFFNTISKPFDFIEREKEKHALKSLQKSMMDVDYNNDFKAKPYPDFLFSQEVEKKAKEEAWKRYIENSKRAEEMLKKSKLPNNMMKTRRRHICSLSCDNQDEIINHDHGDHNFESYKSILSKKDDFKIDKRIQREIEAELKLIKV